MKNNTKLYVFGYVVALMAIVICMMIYRSTALMSMGYYPWNHMHVVTHDLITLKTLVLALYGPVVAWIGVKFD